MTDDDEDPMRELEAIRARHEACGHTIAWPDSHLFESHIDRATLLRLLDAAREELDKEQVSHLKTRAKLTRIREAASDPMLIDADERTTVRIFTPYETDVPAQNEIIIGNFKLRPGRAPGMIWIETAGGEGGDFPIADIEALIREYYHANF